MRATASDFDDYNSTAGTTNEFTLPEITGGWIVATDAFPQETTGNIGNFKASGRMIAANDKRIYLQKNYGSNEASAQHRRH